MGRKIKGFSFDPVRDKDVIEHLGKQQNGSKYILGLINKDMQTEGLTEVLVREYVEKYMKKPHEPKG